MENYRVGSSPDKSGSSPSRKKPSTKLGGFFIKPTSGFPQDHFVMRVFKKTNLLNFKQRRKNLYIKELHIMQIKGLEL